MFEEPPDAMKEQLPLLTIRQTKRPFMNYQASQLGSFLAAIAPVMGANLIGN